MSFDEAEVESAISRSVNWKSLRKRARETLKLGWRREESKDRVKGLSLQEQRGPLDSGDWFLSIPLASFFLGEGGMYGVEQGAPSFCAT